MPHIWRIFAFLGFIHDQEYPSYGENNPYLNEHITKQLHGVVMTQAENYCNFLIL